MPGASNRPARRRRNSSNQRGKEGRPGRAEDTGVGVAGGPAGASGKRGASQDENQISSAAWRRSRWVCARSFVGAEQEKVENGVPIAAPG